MKPRADVVLRELNDLGSADAIAEHLYAFGITGKQIDPRKCAITNYLNAMCAGRWMTGALYTSRFLFKCHQLPPRVLLFRERFDSGSYPFLTPGGRQVRVEAERRAARLEELRLQKGVQVREEVLV